jgi:hypothetical protein
MKANITLKIDEDLLREARIWAAQEGKYVSTLLGEHLEKLVRDRKSYDAACQRALARLKKGTKLGWRPSTRGERHER